ncbi:MAG: hypothetical protein DRP83_04910 [Planctomycetota bacterium]|nr:MAG: hypothetical protein DRP83_04910 [Planctomycetota bacterium]
MSATTEQRRDSILSQVYESGRVTIKNLAEGLGVSQATVRRDIRGLAQAGQVEIVHGGATLPRKSDFSFRSKAMRNIEAKRIIGKLAAQLVSQGDLIFMDSGTTCFQMVPFLKARQGLSIIANSARLALELDSPGLSVILLGGQYRPARMDTVGPMAQAALEQLRGYRAFIGVDGLSMDFGLTAGDIDSAAIYRQAIVNSRESILLADHGKFLSPSLFKIADFDKVSKVITDSPPPAEWQKFLKDHNISVIWPEKEQID